MLRKGEMMWVLYYLQIIHILMMFRIIPPCVDYRYYATAPTIISGRYFWNYNSMHLTEVARTKGHARFSLYPYSSVDALDCHTTMCRMLSVLPFTDFPGTFSLASSVVYFLITHNHSIGKKTGSFVVWHDALPMSVPACQR